MGKDGPPEHYRKLNERFPEFMRAVQNLGKTAQESGPLDEKTVLLIQLGAAAADRSEGSVRSHVRRALAAGAEEAEIQHALLAVTSTIGFPNVAAALNWAHKELD
ncbi:carboxymuconolactone decarboxylase family protein [Desulfohalovibrio reitneri]|uniref:carboxymuconolactone decarboxylase family protein n=1 Tax=Desulfohalovibrio reitneri TaxID=1307759 RepID=UPI0004A71AB8|nr:carboxymuconolactone decarboxylase family protein [Desulfohalovibrio reitneri]